MLRELLSSNDATYSVAKSGENIMVGGGDWNRKTTPYSEEVIENAKGILYILNEGEKPERKLLDCPMIYSLTSLDGDFFLGCRESSGGVNIVNKEGNLIDRRDDPGQGIYNSLFDERESEVVCSTRRGEIEIFNPNDLELLNSFQVSDPGTRLWSIEKDKERIYTGDYQGIFRVFERNSREYKEVTKIDLRKRTNKEKGKDLGLCIWGLEVLPEEVLIGTRWAGLFILNKDDLDIRRNMRLEEDICGINKSSEFSNDEVLIGTRYGKLLGLDLTRNKLEKILEVSPYRKYNPIWDSGIAETEEGCLVCFSDGSLYKYTLED